MNKALEITNLNKTYEGGFIALKDVNLTVEEGDFFALLGANGAGKSTMIGIITSLIRKTSGSVKMFGYDLDKDLYEIQSLVGVVPQEFNFNAFEKVEDIIINQAGFYGFPKKSIKPKVEYYLKKLGLWEKRKSMARTLSGGMKRRLMIARAMVVEPKLLILDEPTAGVDLELRRSMWDFILKINKEEKITIILTTHYLEEAEQLCKNVAIIDEGKVIEQTDMKSLLSRLEVETILLETSNLKDISGENLKNIGYKIKIIDEISLEVELEKNNSLSDLFAKLAKNNIEVKRVQNKSNRLEELFIRLVGKNTKANKSGDNNE